MQTKTILVAIIAVLSVSLAGALGYQKLTQPEVMPIAINQPVINKPAVNQPVIKQLTANCLKEGKHGTTWLRELDQNKNRIDDVCCTGLLAINDSITFENDEGVFCNQTTGGLGAGFICAYCGNGVCGIGENKCNCPQDCGNPSTKIQKGRFDIDPVKVTELQNALDSGHQPWLGDAFSVLKANGLSYGFTADELGKAKEVLPNETDLAQYEVYHNGVAYIISLIQPGYNGPGKLWMILEIKLK